MTEDLERMFRLLVTTLTAEGPERLTRPFEVADLYQNILPYRLYRRELGLETNQDYEIRLTELLSGAGGYLVVDDRMAEVLGRELASPNPDPGAFRQFAHLQVSIHPDALAREAGARIGTPAPRPASEAQPTPAGAMSATPRPRDGESATLPSGRPAIVPAAGDRCRFCGGALPEGRAITFCPHCGQDQTVVHCEACGSELEVGWKFCTTCGKGVA